MTTKPPPVTLPTDEQIAAEMLQAAKDWAAASLEPMIDAEGYANNSHFDAKREAERKMIRLYLALRAKEPVAVEGLDFTIERRGGLDILTWRSGGCRPASLAEIAMWAALSQPSVARR